MYNDQRVNSRDSRPSSITRSIRGSFSSELEVLPPEKIDQNSRDLEINEEIECEIDEEIEQGEEFKCNLDIDTEDPPSIIESPSSTPEIKKEESDLERKIRRGLKKIDKLDKILIQKIQKEKEVKRERLALQRDFQKQVQTLIEEKGVENVVGCQQLLSLCAAPDDLNESQDIENDEAYIGPIFATQIDSEFYKDQKQGNESHRSDNKGEDGEVDANDKKKNADKKKVDFIKRNINLAAHANETIALTDEERKRLDELLADDNDLLVGENPFSTPALKDDGFQFSLQDQRSLEEIDAKLREFMPDVDFEADSVLSQSQTSIVTSSHSAETSDTPIGLVDKEAKCGEKVLDDGQNARIMVLRLSEIEKKLNDLRLRVDTPISEMIDPDLLRSLLEVDSRMTSDSKSICDSLRSHSQLLSERDDVSELLSIMSSQDAQTDLSHAEGEQNVVTEDM